MTRAVPILNHSFTDLFAWTCVRHCLSQKPHVGVQPNLVSGHVREDAYSLQCTIPSHMSDTRSQYNHGACGLTPRVHMCPQVAAEKRGAPQLIPYIKPSLALPSGLDLDM